MLCAILLKDCYLWLWILLVNCCMLSLCSMSSLNQIGTQLFLSILTSTHSSHLSTLTDCTNWCSSTTLYLTHKLWMFLMANFLDPWSSWHPAKIVRNISWLTYQNIFAMNLSFVFPHFGYVRKDWMSPLLRECYCLLMLLLLPTLSIFFNIWRYWNFRVHAFISIEWYLYFNLKSLIDNALTVC